MANISVFATTATSIEVIVSYLDTSNPEKLLKFYVDGSHDGDMDVDAVEVAGIGVDYVYTGLSAGYEYNLRVDVYVWDQFDGWVIETSASVRGSTDGGGGGGTWSLVTERSFTSIDTERFLDMTILAGEVHRCAVTFASSGTATFYTTGSKDTRGYLSTSTSFDDDNGKPNNDIADDDDSGDDNNFRFTYNITAGTTYYVWVRLYSASNSGSVTLYITPPTGGGGGWTLTSGGLRFNISSQETLSPTISAGQTSVIIISFANSGSVTFYSTGSGDMIGLLAPESTGFDGSTGNPTAILAQDDDSGDGNNFRFTYNVTAGTYYALFVRHQSVSASSSPTVYIVPESLSTITLWDWDASNGNATAAQTRLAYTAITSHGSLSDFSYKVWNDMCSKVNEICAELGGSWHIGNYLPYGETLMSDQDKVLTAIRFNALIHQFDHKGYVSTGIEEQQIGDTVFGSYFLTIAECINDWIEKL